MALWGRPGLLLRHHPGHLGGKKVMIIIAAAEKRLIFGFCEWNGLEIAGVYAHNVSATYNYSNDSDGLGTILIV